MENLEKEVCGGYASNFFPVIISYASRYFAMVLSTISCGSVRRCRMGSKPVAGELFVEGRLTVAWLIAFCRPETGTVRCEHPSPITRLPSSSRPNSNFCIGNDDSLCGAYSAHFLQSDGVVTKKLRILAALSGSISRDGRCSARRRYSRHGHRSQPLWTGIDRLRELIGFL